MRATILPLVLLATLAIHAQTHFYIDQIAVVPGNPTTSDNVSIQLIGNLSDGGAYIASAGATVTGGMVVLDVVAESNGGITVLIPHTEVIMLGQLAAGDYEISFGGGSSAVWDMAPLEEHFFTVTGSGGGSPCDTLDIISVRWGAFSDTALVVHVQNNTSTLFDYPNFILFNAQGDTLAMETVNYFGIGNESWHIMRVMDGVTIPDVPFTGTLELWTLFTTELACTWQQTFDLCPPTPCAELRPTVANVSGMLVTGAFNWVMYDDADIVGSGQFTLGADQMADTVLCLPPGEYHVNVSPIDPGFMGILYYYVTAPGMQSTPTMPVTASLPVLLPFTFYGPCIAGSQSIVEPVQPALITAPRAGGMLVQHPEAAPLGPVWLFDAQGRLLFSTTATTDRLFVPMGKPGVYLLRAGDRTVKVVGGME